MKHRFFSTLTATLSAIVLLPSAAMAQTLPPTLRQGMPYAEAREALLDAGWQAVYQSPNRERFGAVAYLVDELGYGEVVDCAGTGMGFCLFAFTDAEGNQLAVTTVNNQPGQQPTLYGWRLEP